MVNVFASWPGEGGKAWRGWKVRRNEASEFRCLTVKDIVNEVLDETIEEIGEAHSLQV